MLSLFQPAPTRVPTICPYLTKAARVELVEAGFFLPTQFQLLPLMGAE